jgi:hypothetical protein
VRKCSGYAVGAAPQHRQLAVTAALCYRSTAAPSLAVTAALFVITAAPQHISSKLLHFFETTGEKNETRGHRLRILGAEPGSEFYSVK